MVVFSLILSFSDSVTIRYYSVKLFSEYNEFSIYFLNLVLIIPIVRFKVKRNSRLSFLRRFLVPNREEDIINGPVRSTWLCHSGQNKGSSRLPFLFLRFLFRRVLLYSILFECLQRIFVSHQYLWWFREFRYLRNSMITPDENNCRQY